jgi:hypothetical protein
MTEPQSLTKWKFRHAVLIWIGIVANMAFALPLLFCPSVILAFFGIPDDPAAWPRLSGLLLGIVSIFYIPATIDIDRYRLIAWLAVFPSRTFGTIFCISMVFVLGQPVGLLAGAVLDGTFGAVTLYCLIKIVRLEAAIAQGTTR